MNSESRPVVLLLVLVLALAACGTEGSQNADDPDGVTAGTRAPDALQSLDGAWVLVSATVDGSVLSLNDEYRVTMTIEGSSIGGRAACNSYGGAVAIGDGGFRVGELSQTEMACEPAVMEIESAFLDGLMRVTAATRLDGTTLLTGEGVEFTFELLPPVPASDLVGVTWVLDTIIQGEAASSTSADAEPATLLLASDGTFTGGTGCRAVSGEYVITGDIVQFTSFGAEGDCASDLEWQDGQVISVLEGGFTVAIDGNRLTITSPGGEGLSYTAG